MNINMRTRNFRALAIGVFLFGSVTVSAQATSNKKVKKEVKVQRHTIMERFAPDISLTAEQRKEKKVQHLKDIQLKKSVLDTMDISERRRQKLMADLLKTPYSNRLYKAMADVKFEEDDDDIDN